VALFKDLINLCISFGDKYAPARADLQIKALQTLLTDAETSLSVINLAAPVYAAAVAAKDEAFAPLSKLSTKVLNAFLASGPQAGMIDNVTTLCKKLKGEARKIPVRDEPAISQNGGEEKPGDEKTVKRTNSHSQMSADMRVENLNRVIELLASTPGYKPNETEISIASLKQFAANLKTVSEAVLVAEAPLLAARDKRNTILYISSSSLLAIADAVKKYLRSAFDADSAQYKRVLALRFKHAE
jgi:hypothetical protein